MSSPIIEPYKKQFAKVVSVARSVAGLAEMCEVQGKKVAANASPAKGGDRKVFEKAIEATVKGRLALEREIKVLIKEAENLKTLEGEMNKYYKSTAPKK